MKEVIRDVFRLIQIIALLFIGGLLVLKEINPEAPQTHTQLLLLLVAIALQVILHLTRSRRYRYFLVFRKKETSHHGANIYTRVIERSTKMDTGDAIREMQSIYRREPSDCLTRFELIHES